MLSIILPAKNEAGSVAIVLQKIRKIYGDAELILVDDGSSDATATLAAENGARVISHPYSMGNGAAIKSGARAASGDILVFMDADQQHDPADIPRLLEKLDEGFDMVVGARSRSSQASLWRGLANKAYNRFASFMTGHPVLDLTSGFRAVRRTKFMEYLHLLPNGFSYPTTITMAFFRSGYPIAYLPITAHKREGKSHIRPLYDGMRFFLIIFKVGTLYSPLKIFMPISLAHFAAGVGYYAYTYLTLSRFTNMGALLLTTSVLIFLIGLVSEQITALIYQKGKS